MSAKKIAINAAIDYLKNDKIPQTLKIEVRALARAMIEINYDPVYIAAYRRIIDILMTLPDEFFDVRVEQK